MTHEDDWLNKILEETVVNVDDNKLSGLSRAVALLQEKERRVKHLETLLSGAKEEARLISEVAVPELMSEIGMKKFTLSSGVKVEIKDFISGKILDNAALDWFEDNGDAEIVKMNLTFTVRRKDKAVLQAIVDHANHLEVDVVLKETIHYQTLSSVLREKMAQGARLPPPELVEVYVGRKTVLK